MRRMKEPPFGEAVKAWVKSPPGPPTARKFTLARCHARLSIWVDGDGVQYGWDELVDPEPYQKNAFFAYVEEPDPVTPAQATPDAHFGDVLTGNPTDSKAERPRVITVDPRVHHSGTAIWVGDFEPADPDDGDLWVPRDGPAYRWDGDHWFLSTTVICTDGHIHRKDKQ